MDFSIDIFLSGNYDLLTECACAYKEHEEALPTELVVVTEAPVVDVDCTKVLLLLL